MPDPAAVQGSEDVRERAFRDAAVTMKRRLELMLTLPLNRLNALAMQKDVRDIGGR